LTPFHQLSLRTSSESSYTPGTRGCVPQPCRGTHRTACQRVWTCAPLGLRCPCLRAQWSSLWRGGSGAGSAAAAAGRLPLAVQLRWRTVIQATLAQLEVARTPVTGCVRPLQQYVAELRSAPSCLGFFGFRHGTLVPACTAFPGPRWPRPQKFGSVQCAVSSSSRQQKAGPSSQYPRVRCPPVSTTLSFLLP
jgi:hypothetical protein